MSDLEKHKWALAVLEDLALYFTKNGLSTCAQEVESVREFCSVSLTASQKDRPHSRFARTLGGNRSLRKC